MSKLCTVITATTGNPILKKCVESVMRQTHNVVQHLLFVDGPERKQSVEEILDKSDYHPNTNIIQLPYSVGKDRWNGHRMYGAGSYLAEGDYIIFLDDDNYIDPTHIEDCLKIIESGKDWAYSLRKLVDKEGNDLGNDDCESLGKWPSVLHPEDFFIDVNCYFLKRMVAVAMTPVWYRKFREPGQMEIDRLMFRVLTQKITPNYDCTYKYTLNYTVGNSPLSVQPEFFKRGNEEMFRRYNGVLPWKK